MSHFKRFILIFLVCFLGTACPNINQTNHVYDGTILRPVATSFTEGSKIVFMADTTAPQLQWESSIEGVIGYGTLIQTALTVGTHQILLKNEDFILDSKIITIASVGYVPGSFVGTQLKSGSNSLLLPEGRFSPLCYSIGTSSVSVSINDASISTSSNSRLQNSQVENSSFFSKKSFTLEDSNVVNEDMHKRVSLYNENTNRTVFTDRLDTPIGTRQDFILADTTGKTRTGIPVSAQLGYSGTCFTIWLDSSLSVQEEDLISFASSVEELIFPRLFSIWGDSWADIDADGKIAVLISPLINEQAKAIGFFNPNDFYTRITDISSDLYNPVSNEMDVVYLASPFGNPTEFAYSMPSVKATLAHETYHLIMYSRKPFWSELAGVSDALQEKRFLDEGLAHLTESLIGFGVSGGNIAFYSRYLQNTASISAQFQDLDGKADSVAKRGMVSAFLSWLFWRQGGAEWDAQNSGLIHDNGGIAFLRDVLNDTSVGWDCLSNALGIPADILLVEWFESLEKQDRLASLRQPVYIDPITHEIITICAFAGTFTLGETVFHLDGPVRYDLSTPIAIAPYAAVFGTWVDLPGKTRLGFSSTVKDSLTVLRFYMWGD